jgi:hypothetical protein
MNAEDFKSAGKNQPSQDFTKHLMQQIQQEDQALDAVLRRHGKMETSESFVMAFAAQLEKENVRKPYTPLFSAKSWALVACVALTLIVAALMLGTSPESEVLPEQFTQANDFVQGILHHYLTPYMVLPILLMFTLAIYRPSRKIQA